MPSIENETITLSKQDDAYFLIESIVMDLKCDKSLTDKDIIEILEKVQELVLKDHEPTDREPKSIKMRGGGRGARYQYK